MRSTIKYFSADRSAHSSYHRRSAGRLFWRLCRTFSPILIPIRRYAMIVPLGDSCS